MTEDGGRVSWFNLRKEGRVRHRNKQRCRLFPHDPTPLSGLTSISPLTEHKWRLGVRPVGGTNQTAARNDSAAAKNSKQPRNTKEHFMDGNRKECSSE